MSTEDVGLPEHVNEVVLSIAKRIYNFNHPRKQWLHHPNYGQAREQERYLELARVLFYHARGEQS